MIGELTIANRVLKKNGGRLVLNETIRQDITTMMLKRQEFESPGCCGRWRFQRRRGIGSRSPQISAAVPAPHRSLSRWRWKRPS